MERNTTNIFPLPSWNAKVIFEFPFLVHLTHTSAKRSHGFYVLPLTCNLSLHLSFSPISRNSLLPFKTPHLLNMHFSVLK